MTLYNEYVWLPFHQIFGDVAKALERYTWNYAEADGGVQKRRYVQHAN